jgi:hypothetical protein
LLLVVIELTPIQMVHIQAFVSLRSMRISIVAAELNKLDIVVGDVYSAYLEAYTQEKVSF